jgi:hypothetical protein
MMISLALLLSVGERGKLERQTAQLQWLKLEKNESVTACEDSQHQLVAGKQHGARTTGVRSDSESMEWKNRLTLLRGCWKLQWDKAFRGSISGRERTSGLAQLGFLDIERVYPWGFSAMVVNRGS